MNIIIQLTKPFLVYLHLKRTKISHSTFLNHVKLFPLLSSIDDHSPFTIVPALIEHAHDVFMKNIAFPELHVKKVKFPISTVPSQARICAGVHQKYRKRRKKNGPK